MNKKKHFRGRTISMMVIGILISLPAQGEKFSLVEEEVSVYTERLQSIGVENVGEEIPEALLVQPLATTQSFTFTIRQPFDDDFIVPTNGQTTFSGKIPYSWEIFLDGVSQGIFTGVSKNVNASTVGPVLTNVSAGIHTITLVPTKEHWGWLRAFGTFGYTENHRSASKIIGIGSNTNPIAIPYKGIAQSSTTNNLAGKEMFANCVNLATITGSILSLTDDAEWRAVSTVGNDFFFYTFHNTALTTLPNGSFDISTVTAVGDYFFGSTFSATPLLSLPNGSFNTTNLTTVGNDFFSSTFSSAKLVNLPDGSFNTSNITTGNKNFLSATFFQNSLISLPANSFNISNITNVDEGFLSYTFYNNHLTTLPANSFISTLSAKEINKNDVFKETFYDNHQLAFDISTMPPYASVEPDAIKNTFYGTKTSLSPNAGRTEAQIKRRGIQGDTLPPVVTLHGNTPLRILQNDKYRELGASRTDDGDGSGTLTVPTYGKVNTAVLGTYTLLYDYQDKAGNWGRTERIVKVLDPTGDEDGDGYTNAAEINGGTNPEDSTSFPVSNSLPSPVPVPSPVPTPTPSVPSTPIVFGGGGGHSLKKDRCPNGDFSPSYYDNKCEEKGEKGEKTETYQGKSDIPPLSTYAIANLSTMHIPLTRAEMAKMMVTITALIKERTNKLVSTGRTKKEQCSTFSDLNQANEKLQPFIIKACELGLMGLQANGITLKTHFIPNETITIAEVATILSRFLRGNKYQGSEQRRYHNHLLALQQINFMPLNINPMNKERKTNVFEMLIKSITFINTYSK